MINSSTRAFSLVELMIVVAIFAVLVSLLTPSLQRTLYKSKKLLCVNNLKMQVSGLLIYSEDNNDFYPCPETGWRKSDNYGGKLMIIRNYHNGDIRPQIRPYWGWDGQSTVNNWGVLYPAKTDIERCPLRNDPTIDDAEPITHYTYLFSTDEDPRIARVGDASYLNDSQSQTALVSDIFVDRQSRIANHTELQVGFRAMNSGGHHGRAWELVNRSYLKAINGNFGGQDGSVVSDILPDGPGYTWVSYPGFKRSGWDRWIPNEYVIGSD